MPKVAPGEVKFMACTISRSACTTKELPLRSRAASLCTSEKLRARERLAKNRCERKRETHERPGRVYANWRNTKGVTYIGPLAILKFHKIFYDYQLSMHRDHPGLVADIYLLLGFGVSTYYVVLNTVVPLPSTSSISNTRNTQVFTAVRRYRST